MDRLSFFESISGIAYPQMLVHFFDQFLALKEITNSSANIVVETSTETSITFIIEFNDKISKENCIRNIPYGQVIVYGKPIYVNMEHLTDTKTRICLLQ